MNLQSRKCFLHLLPERFRSIQIVRVRHLQMHTLSFRIMEPLRKIVLHRLDHQVLRLLDSSRLGKCIQLLSLDLQYRF